MTVLLSNDFETDTAGLTLGTSGSATVLRTASAALTGDYGLAAQADSLERATATASAPAAVWAGGRYAAGCLLRASAVDQDVLVMWSNCFRLWLLSGGVFRLDVRTGRNGESISFDSITSAAGAVSARRAARVVVEIVRDSADGESDGLARLWLDGEQIGELAGLDLYQTATSIATAMGADRSFADHHIIFDEAYASNQQVMGLGSEVADLTVYRQATAFDGSGDVAKTNHIPTSDTAVSMVVIPTLQGTLDYFYGNASFGFGVNAAGNAQMIYRGSTVVGGPVTDGVEQTWEMTASGESAGLVIDGELVASATASAAMVSDAAYLGALNSAGAATNFSAISVLRLTAAISAPGEYDYTFHSDTVDAIAGSEVVYNQGTLGAAGDLSNGTMPGSIVGADLEAEAIGTHDVGLESGTITAASTRILDSGGAIVRPLVNNQSATLACKLRVPTGSLSISAQILWGFGLNLANFNYTCGVYGTTTLLRFYVATGSGANQKVYETALPTDWAKVALVFDKDDPTPANNRIRVYINGVEVASVASTIGDTWPGHPASNPGPTGSSHLYGVNKHDPKLELREGIVEQRAWTAAEAIAWTGGIV